MNFSYHPLLSLPLVPLLVQDRQLLFNCWPLALTHWEDGAAWRGAGTAGSPPSLPCSRRLIISKGGGVKSTNSAVHPSGSIFVCDSLSGRLISKAVSPAAASSSSSPCHPTPRHEIFPAIESFKTCTALNLKPMPACLPAFVSLIG